MLEELSHKKEKILEKGLFLNLFSSKAFFLSHLDWGNKIV